MKMTKLLLAGAMGLFLIGPAHAQPGMGMPAEHQGMGHMGMHGDPSHFLALLKSANLTTAQNAQVQQILESAHAQVKPEMRQFHALHEQIAAKLLSTGPVTAADLAPMTQKAFRLQQQIDVHMIDTVVAIRNLLTPEQLNRLAQVHQQLQSLHSQIRNLVGPESEESEEAPN